VIDQMRRRVRHAATAAAGAEAPAVFRKTRSAIRPPHSRHLSRANPWDWLGPPFWGRGVATEALRAVTDYAFTTLDICRLEAGVFDWNPASARVLEKAGDVLEGRFRLAVTKAGRTGDRLLYALVRS
jgi:RimJ/RimL family protein N-acetyltransferase